MNVNVKRYIDFLWYITVINNEKKILQTRDFLFSESFSVPQPPSYFLQLEYVLYVLIPFTALTPQFANQNFQLLC